MLTAETALVKACRNVLRVYDYLATLLLMRLLPQESGATDASDVTKYRYVGRRFLGGPNGPVICAFDLLLQQRVAKVQLFLRGPQDPYWCCRYGEGDSCVRTYSVKALGYQMALQKAVALRLEASGHPLGHGVGDRVLPPVQQQQQPHQELLLLQQDTQAFLQQEIH